MEGPEAERYLQGVLTSDVAALPVGGSGPSLLLSAKGRIQVDLRVVREGPTAFTLVSTGNQGERLMEGLGRLLVSEDAELLGPEPFEMITLLDGIEPEGEFDLSLAGRAPDTWDLVGASAADLMAALGAVAGDPAELERRRILATIPTIGVDYQPDEALVQELALEQVAVSFDKGCYLGQETVARTAYRGKVNRRLRLVHFEGPVAPGAAVLVKDTPVGNLTSVSFADGLAILRREAVIGTTVTAEGVRGTVGQPVDR